MFLLETVNTEASALKSKPLDVSEEIYDTLWPEWVVQENFIDRAKDLIGKMFDHLENKEGIPAEAAFGMYDIRDKGNTSEEHFRKILKSFFSDVLATENDYDFITRLGPKNYYDLTIDYRAFCRFLDKKFVRSFRATSVENSIL